MKRGCERKSASSCGDCAKTISKAERMRWVKTNMMMIQSNMYERMRRFDSCAMTGEGCVRVYIYHKDKEPVNANTYKLVA